LTHQRASSAQLRGPSKKPAESTSRRRTMIAFGCWFQRSDRLWSGKSRDTNSLRESIAVTLDIPEGRETRRRGQQRCFRRSPSAEIFRPAIRSTAASWKAPNAGSRAASRRSPGCWRRRRENLGMSDDHPRNRLGGSQSSPRSSDPPIEPEEGRFCRRSGLHPDAPQG
jgi:hypothetical protein